MALHVSDFSKAPADIIIDLIAADNTTKPITNQTITLGVPTVAAVVDASGDTELEVTAKAGSGYTGSEVVKYNRLDLQGFTFGETFSLPVGDAENLADLILEVNTGLGVNLTADDYTDSAIGAWAGEPNETKVVSLPITAGSLVFKGALSITLHAEDIPLSEVITVTTLSGLNYPAAPVV
jgi:hypothetical protein